MATSTKQPPAGAIQDIAAESLPATLAALQVNPDTGLTQADVNVRLKTPATGTGARSDLAYFFWD